MKSSLALKQRDQTEINTDKITRSQRSSEHLSYTKYDINTTTIHKVEPEETKKEAM